MAREESGVERIAPDFIRLTDNVDPSETQRRARLSDKRWARYRRLFREAQVPGGVGISPDGVYFYVFDAGLAGGGSSRGYLWSPRPPKPLANEIHAAAPGAGGGDVFRPITGNWYLEYSGG